MARKPFVVTAAALLGVVLLLPVAAQTQYKSTMPDGRVVYGDRPAQGAAKVEEIQSDTSKGGLGGPATPSEKQVLKELEKERLQRESAQEKVRAAEQKLKDAQAARDNGKEPLPGERIGTAGGASRLNDAYFERQRMLEEAVWKAQRELDEARSGR
ncbi:MAG: DUF4124 domain-containing protein [Betaproteobacteria bacterium]|nr:DUF4124 domain-containing protein [Betaproteobacteria bacterium]MDH5222070.1 DUF4124 domain-containing protein [Betaproteobacteria bacterium]MDH5351649.1 DUF4124 domain-containing protein [Betaproteobacteria bacterium]